MASLYIKDRETAELAAELARRLGQTKTQVVRDALERRKAELPPPPRVNFLEWLEEYHRTHPLPPPTGLKADKAFFDEMWGE